MEATVVETVVETEETGATVVETEETVAIVATEEETEVIVATEATVATDATGRTGEGRSRTMPASTAGNQGTGTLIYVDYRRRKRL